MNIKNILVYDSGIGGLSVLSLLNKALNNKNIIYYGDNFNAPYGSMNERVLYYIVSNNILNLPFDIDLIVLGCNTASLSIRRKIEERFNIKTIGVFPCIENQIINNKKILLLGTPLTISKIKDAHNLTKIGLKNLAFDIERNIFNVDSLDLSEHFNQKNNYSIDYIKNQAYDTVILGCTHYHFIENQIFNHFRPLEIISGNFYTLNEVVKYCKCGKSLDNSKRNNLLFYGEFADFNEKVYDKFYKNH